MKKMLNRADILLIILLLFISLTPLLFLTSQKPDRVYADITVEGKLTRRIPLSGHTGRDTFVISHDGHSNTIVVEDDTIAVTEADCPDKRCILQGPAQKPGGIIACLPHKLLIEVKGEQPEADLIPMR